MPLVRFGEYYTNQPLYAAISCFGLLSHDVAESHIPWGGKTGHPVTRGHASLIPSVIHGLLTTVLWVHLPHLGVGGTFVGRSL